MFYTDIKILSDGSFALSEKGTKKVTIYSSSSFDKVSAQFSFDQTPTGLVESKGDLYVTTFQTKGMLHKISLKDSTRHSLEMESGAISPLINATANELYVLNQFTASVICVDLNDFTIKKKVSVLREPKVGVIDGGCNYLFVANYLPHQRADIDMVAACVSVIDLRSFKKIKDIPLYNGSNALRGIALSPDGKYVLITHNLGRFQVPTNQLQQGWMNTSAMSLISVEDLSLSGTVLLDEAERGAAGIWGVASCQDKIVVTQSGTHDVSVIDYPAFIRKFESYPQKDALAYDLRFMYGVRTRFPLEGNGPRSFVIENDTAYIPTYFSDVLNIVSLSDRHVTPYLLVTNREESDQMKGEKYFNDASYCFQNWQSCNGCHPGDARMDAMNWDLMNDGIGNSKNCKSLLYSHITPPSMISGIRVSAELAVRKGFALIQFSELSEEKAVCVDQYLRSLQPVPSPYLVKGELSDKAKAGRKVFDKFHCGDCHSGPLFTDMKMHRIGDDIEFEKGWDTPTLIEAWRTAPYLFDGRAASMKEVFERHKHGINGKISKKELDELVEYVNSL